MNNMMDFHNDMFGDIRAMEQNGEPWFVGKDVAAALGYANTRDAIVRHVDEEDKTTVAIHDTGSNYKSMAVIINESGLYSLVLSSKLPQARAFKRWVTQEVLPTIRRHGAYITVPTLERIIASPDYGIALLQSLKEERRRRMEAENEAKKLKPMADYTAVILACPDTVSITQIAQDYGMSAIALNKILYKAHIQYSVGGQWILYADYKDMGLVQSYTHNFRHTDGSDGCRMYTRWTQQGRLFLYNKLKAMGILPKIEQNDLFSNGLQYSTHVGNTSLTQQ
jgi:anti-repressor protein